ncbi:MAG: hypothetical protein JWR61_1377 [Ferruginibacter sp.]|nr:hypothetical protein [Ferruginibacter sp.]
MLPGSEMADDKEHSCYNKRKCNEQYYLHALRKGKVIYVVIVKENNWCHNDTNSRKQYTAGKFPFP